MKKIALLLALATSSAFANADVLFQNSGTPSSAWCSPCYSTSAFDFEYRVWDQFTLSQNSTISSLDFTIYDISPNGAAQNINVSIWDAPGGNMLLSQTYNSSQWTAAGTALYTYNQLSVNTNWTLASGSYYLSILVNRAPPSAGRIPARPSTAACSNGGPHMARSTI